MDRDFWAAIEAREPATARPMVQVAARRFSEQATRENRKRRRPPEEVPGTYAGPGRGPNGESSN